MRDAMRGATVGPRRLTSRPAVRHVLTVAFVDVVGFAKLMAGDEAGTFHRWRRIRDEIVLPTLDDWTGALIKSTGDGILATFADSEDALRWSAEVQRRARVARVGLSLRIALNRCPVLLDEGDPIGDGVNVAARLQERAAPGGVIFTRSVWEDVQALDLPCRRIGHVTLKSFVSPVEAFELLTDGRLPGAWSSEELDRPSIAVLPFRNVAKGHDDDYFAEGLVEDVVTSLSGLKDLVVVSRQSTLTVASGPLSPVDIGRALAVRYVVNGAVRRADGRLRATVRLTDAMSGETLTNDAFEFREDVLFAMQDALVERVVARIAPNVRAAELRRTRRKPPESFTAYDCYLRGLDGILRSDRPSFEQGYSLLERAMELDPGFAMPFAWAARSHSIKVGQGWSEDRRTDELRAADLAAHAIAIDRDNALALATFGHIRSYLFADYDTAKEFLTRARTASPSCVVAWVLSSATSSYLGETELAIEQAEHALRLSPFDPQLFMAFHFLSIAHFVAGRHDEAERWGRRAQVENPRYTSISKVLAASLMALGRDEEAKAQAAMIRQLEPGFRVSNYDGTGRPFRSTTTTREFKALLQRAGIPD